MRINGGKGEFYLFTKLYRVGRKLFVYICKEIVALSKKGRQEKMNAKTKVLSFVKEVKETRDVKEVAKLLSSGNWIAICATTDMAPLFSLGRIN